jgi:predicted ATPase
MSDTIKRITIEGFKSIRKLDDFELRPLNVLIGANGAGKSNFVEFFRLVRELAQQRLQVTIGQAGGPDASLFLGPKVTKQVVGKAQFGGGYGYEFTLLPTLDGRFVFGDETVVFADETVDFTDSAKLSGAPQRSVSLAKGHFEASLKNRCKDDFGWNGSARQNVPAWVFDGLSGLMVYHFHDTSSTAGVRRQIAINQNGYLYPDGSNLAAFLYRIQYENRASYERIQDVVRLAAPFFAGFQLRPNPLVTAMIQLEWRQKDSDYPFLASHLSDGTLRFMCLATALLQPSPPATMLFDEPELGAHPYALTLLANLFQQAAKDTFRQVIVSTQSAQLVNEFEPEDIIVVERVQGESVFRRLESAKLSGWLDDYTLGELWQKNVFGGGPRNEAMPLPPDSDGNPPPSPNRRQRAQETNVRDARQRDRGGTYGAIIRPRSSRPVPLRWGILLDPDHSWRSRPQGRKNELCPP